MTTNYEIRTFSKDDILVESRRNHIVRCSTKAFVKKGYSRTNMREIARSCKMSIGALYHYFGSKEEILYSIIHGATSEQASYIENCNHDLASMSPTKTLTELIKKHFEWHNNNQDTTLFAYQETKSLPEDARLNIFDSEARIIAVFEKILARGIEAGEFNMDNPTIIAHDIIVLSHAWVFRRWYLRQYYTFEKYLQNETNFILKAIMRDRNSTK